MNSKRSSFLLLFLSFLIVPSVNPSAEKAPVFLKQSRFVSRAEPSMELKSMMLAFRIQNLAGLQQLLEGQQNPRSAQYHRWLTPEEFGARFGVSDDEFQRVIRWLQQNGMVVTHAYPNRLSVYFDGTVAQVERAFKISIGTYEFEGKRFYSNDRAPQISEPFQDRALGVFGLDNFPDEQPLYRSGTRTSMAPADLHHAYNLLPLYNSGIDGAGQSIAIVARSDFDIGDVQAFRNFFGLPPSDPQKIFVVPGQNPGMSNPSEVTEVLLDAEWSGAMAPAASIQVVIAPTNASISPSLDYIVNRLASSHVVSISFGGGESMVSDLTLIQSDQRYMQAASQGQSVFVASGDNGVQQFAAGSQLSSGPDVNRLCSSPYATCVGGTNLNPVLDVDGNVTEYGEETAWSGSGGGKSKFYAKPAYQFGPGVPKDGMRDVPDVAAMGNPGQQGVYWYQGGTLRCCIGGTSLSAPLWAGLFGLVNQVVAVPGTSSDGVGLANTRIYEMGRTQLTSGGLQTFHDVTVGSNSTGAVPGFSAEVAYDQVTGWGSFNGDLFVQSFASNLSDTGIVNLVSGVQTSAVLAPGSSATTCTLGPSQYTIDVPAGTLQLIVTLSGNQNVNLFLRRDQSVVLAGGRITADYKSETTLPDQTLYVNDQTTPPLVPGTYYIAVANCSNAQTSFALRASLVNPSSALKTEELLVDDGSMESSLPGTGLMVVNRLTPRRYPSKLKAIRIFIPQDLNAQGSLGQSIRLVAFTDRTATNRSPDSPVFLVDQWAVIHGNNGYVDFPILNGPAIDSGDWYIGFQYPASGAVSAALDSSGPDRQGGYVSTDNGATFGGSRMWNEGTPVNLMIRGVVESGPPILDTATASFQADSANGVIRIQFYGRDGQGDVVGLTETRFDAQGQVLGTGSFDIGTRVDNKTSFVSEIAFTGSNRLADTRQIQVQLQDRSGLASDFRIISVLSTPGSSEVNLDLPAAGMAIHATSGTGGAAQAGYATLSPKTGALPYGTAVFALTQNGVVVSEVGVPPSEPTTAAQIFIDYRSSFSAKTGRLDATKIETNTGLAIVNGNNLPADVKFTLRGVDGSPLAVGFGTLLANSHVARFIDQLSDLARGFVFPPDFSSAIQFGTLEIKSSQPLALLALRLTNNSRGDALMTSTPVADLSQAPAVDPLYFPHLVDGGGYKTTLILMNPSATLETGELRILGDNGSSLTVQQINGRADSSFPYAIPPGGLYVFQTDGSPTHVNSGLVQVLPDPARLTPVGAGVLSYSQGGVVVTESGIPSASLTTHARVFVDKSEGHDTGLAVANPGPIPLRVGINVYEQNGVSGAGSGSLDVSAMGHQSRFLEELIPGGLPDEFIGVVDLSSATPFAVLTMRAFTNSRGDFLLTTFPVGIARQSPSPSMIFPQIAEGGGYKTQFFFLNSGPLQSLRLNFFADDGSAIPLAKADRHLLLKVDEEVPSEAGDQQLQIIKD
jgi:hypothetical protein